LIHHGGSVANPFQAESAIAKPAEDLPPSAPQSLGAMTLARLLKNRKHDENVTHCISNHRMKPRPARVLPALNPLDLSFNTGA
jgi:hypothetical protein